MPALGLWLIAILSGTGASQERASEFVQALNPRSNTETVEVTGMVDNRLANKVDAAKRDAYRRAIEQVVGFQVVSKSTAVDDYVKTITDIKLDGFVVASKPIGPPSSAGGGYAQKYAITVKSGEINKGLLSQKIDVRLLYDVVSRPRICLAIEDRFKSDPTADWDSTFQLSNNSIIKYFTDRNPKFEFKDLSLLRQNNRQNPDYVEEAVQYKFDIVIYGQTRLECKTGTSIPVNPANDIGVFDQAPSRYHTSLQWTITEVASKRVLFPVFGETLATEVDTNILQNKSGFLGMKVAELFRDLMAYWNRTALSKPYKIVFRSFEPQDSLKLQRALQQVSGLDSENIKMDGESKGEITYDVVATGDLAEIQSSLMQRFKGEYRLNVAQQGKFELVKEAVGSDGSQVIISVKIGNLTATSASEIQSQIQALGEVSAVQEEAFTGGELTLSVKTSKSAPDLAILLEKNVKKIEVNSRTSSQVFPAKIEAVYRNGQ